MIRTKIKNKNELKNKQFLIFLLHDFKSLSFDNFKTRHMLPFKYNFKLQRIKRKRFLNVNYGLNLVLN